MIPDTGTRSEGITAYCWSIEEFCRERYLRFLFTEADEESSQLASVLERVESRLAREDVSRMESFDDLKEFILVNIDAWAGQYAVGTRSAFCRRLESAAARVGHLIRGLVPTPDRHRIDWRRKQVTVVDIHNLHDRAKRFVIGVVLKRMFERKRKQGPRGLSLSWCSMS